MEHILRNALLALLDQPKATLPDILRLINEKPFRRDVITHIENPQVRTFWQSEFANYSYRFRADSIAPVQNKVGAFLADPTLNRVLTAPSEPISFRKLMDEGRVLLVNLSRGQLGEDSAGLLGGLLVTTIGVAAFSDDEEMCGDRSLKEWQTWARDWIDSRDPLNQGAAAIFDDIADVRSWTYRD